MYMDVLGFESVIINQTLQMTGGAYDEECEQFEWHRQHLKRKREPDPNVLIDLGNPIHDGLMPSMCGPVIKKRFNTLSLMNG